jgi:hypothetical protein
MMKALIAAARGAVAAPVTKLAKAVKGEEPARSRDPWYSDLERRAEINARSSDSRRSWIPRRPGWLR